MKAFLTALFDGLLMLVVFVIIILALVGGFIGSAIASLIAAGLVILLMVTFPIYEFFQRKENSNENTKQC